MAGVSRDITDVKAFMIDMDGTLCKGWDVIPGSPGFIDRLRGKGIPFVLLTNNSSSSRDGYLKKMRSLGFNIEMKNILTSTTATLLFLENMRPGMSVYPLGTEEFMSELKERDIPVSEEADIVLLAFDRSITYEKINTAYHLLMRGAELVCTHPDRLCPTEGGYDVDIGPFIDLFQGLTGCEPVIIGKPGRSMVEMAARHMGVREGDMAMVGDRLYTDMRMAEDNGIMSILVLTGETDPEDLSSSDIEPDVIAASVAELTDLL